MSTKNFRFGAVADDPVGAVRTVVVDAAPQPAEQPEYGSISERAQAGLEAGLWKPEPARQPGSHGVLHTEQTIPFQQPEPSCGWAGCPHGAECVHAKQPEPGGLADAAEAECAALSTWNHSEYAINALDTVHPMFLTAFKLGFAATRKRSDEEVARIMEAVDRFLVASTGGPGTYAASRSEVERLVRGERS